MTIYQGQRDADGHAIVTVRQQGRVRPLRHFVLHSPTGFDWGYAGSGPADLARSLLAHHLKRGVAPPPRVYQAFKFAVVTSLPRDGWTLTTDDIEQALTTICDQHTIDCALCADEGVVWPEQHPRGTTRRRVFCACATGDVLRRVEFQLHHAR
jgi:hypothetical protein